MISQPKLKERAAQPYVGIRTQVPMKMFKQVVPQYLDELFPWLARQGVEPAGPPFMRYHVINMAATMDIELGVPVAMAMAGEGHIKPGIIPAGRYASLVYTGNGIKGNKALLDWAATQGIQWDKWDDPQGDAFGARLEFYLTDPDEEPDRKKWATEVAIRLADNRGNHVMTQLTDEQNSDFPAKLGMPVRNALHHIGVFSLAQVAMIREADLKELHGVGSKGIEQLRVALTAKGLAYATSNFTDKLAAPARRALINAGMINLEQVAQHSEADLKALHGMGPKALDQLRTALAEQGLSFAADKGKA